MSLCNKCGNGPATVVTNSRISVKTRTVVFSQARGWDGSDGWALALRMGVERGEDLGFPPTTPTVTKDYTYTGLLIGGGGVVEKEVGSGLMTVGGTSLSDPEVVLMSEADLRSELVSVSQVAMLPNIQTSYGGALMVLPDKRVVWSVRNTAPATSGSPDYVTLVKDGWVMVDSAELAGIPDGASCAPSQLSAQRGWLAGLGQA
jgi:hypothetical protein